MAQRFIETQPNLLRCPRCGMECISPQPSDEALAAIYNESYFTHYTSESDTKIVRGMKRATYSRQLNMLPPPESFGNDPRLLDCGAATGFLAELAREMGWEAYAVEISEFGSQSCKEILGKDRVFCGELQNASFAANPDGRFEVITMFDFIEHVRNPREVLRHVRQRLVSGGILLLTTPRSGSISWHFMGKHWFHYVREHLWFFTPKSIRSLLPASGFEAVEVRALQKAVSIDYALAHYARLTSHSNLFSPAARVLRSALPLQVKRQILWFYLGEMVVLARAGKNVTRQEQTSFNAAEVAR